MKVSVTNERGKVFCLGGKRKKKGEMLIVNIENLFVLIEYKFITHGLYSIYWHHL